MGREKVNDLESLLLEKQRTIRDAMELINANQQGICFVVDGADRRLYGVVTDGDIRRALLAGAAVSDCIQKATSLAFQALPTGASLQELQALFQQNITHVPILDSNGGVVDFATESSYHRIPIAEPVLDGNELEYLTDCISTGWISSQGRYVTAFEAAFSEFIGGGISLTTSSGTTALHLALLTLGIGPGDEVIVPDLTFIAPVNAVIYAGATPVLADVQPGTLTIDPDAIEAAVTKKTKALVAVHLYGQPADMAAIGAIAEKYGLLVIEDCAEAIGTKYHGAHVGLLGDAAVFSFFGNKTMTTGEGGMVVFSSKEHAVTCAQLRDHGMSQTHRYWHEVIGFNYRLTNLQAAIGLAQLEKVDEFISAKRRVAKEYNSFLKGLSELLLPSEASNVENSFWLYTLGLGDELVCYRDEIIVKLLERGVEARRVFYPVHAMPPYTGYASAMSFFPVATDFSNRGISLPSATNLTASEVEYVAGCFVEVVTEVSGKSVGD